MLLLLSLPPALPPSTPPPLRSLRIMLLSLFSDLSVCHLYVAHPSALPVLFCFALLKTQLQIRGTMLEISRKYPGNMRGNFLPAGRRGTEVDSDDSECNWAKLLSFSQAGFPMGCATAWDPSRQEQRGSSYSSDCVAAIAAAAVGCCVLLLLFFLFLLWLPNLCCRWGDVCALNMCCWCFCYWYFCCWCFCCCCRGLRDVGLVSTHAYSVLEVRYARQAWGVVPK